MTMIDEIPPDVATFAAIAAERLRENFGTRTLPLQQVLCLAEEAGEVQDAYLLWRDGGAIDDLAAEIADVLITAHVTGDVLGIPMGTPLTDPGEPWPAQPNVEVLRLGRSVGDFVGAYRRWSGMARRTGPWDSVVESLAKVTQAAYATAVSLEIDLDAAWRKKATTIMSRGWRDNSAEVSR